MEKTRFGIQNWLPPVIKTAFLGYPSVEEITQGYKGSLPLYQIEVDSLMGDGRVAAENNLGHRKADTTRLRRFRNGQMAPGQLHQITLDVNGNIVSTYKVPSVGQVYENIFEQEKEARSIGWEKYLQGGFYRRIPWGEVPANVVALSSIVWGMRAAAIAGGVAVGEYVTSVIPHAERLSLHVPEALLGLSAALAVTSLAHAIRAAFIWSKDSNIRPHPDADKVYGPDDVQEVLQETPFRVTREQHQVSE